MRALAEFIMRGRMQASLVALLGNLLPLISPATVGLVALRKNAAEAALVLLWACLPLVVTLFVSDADALIVISSLAGSALVLLGAEVLKKSVSWSLALMTVSVATLGLVVLLNGLFALSSGELVRDVQQVVTQLQTETLETPVSVFHLLMAVTALGLGLDQVSAVFTMGFMSWLTALHVVSALLLARWWQAMLYNPGGFQQEFHSLRFDPVPASVLVIGLIALQLGSPEYRVWSGLIGLPLLLAGLGLIHCVVKSRKKGAHWLVIVYVGLVLWGPTSWVLIGIGFLDSLMNLRPRLASGNSQ